MTQLSFTKATKKQARARIAFEGPSGSGKTYTALVTARVLGKRVAVIDTEHRSASLYADEFEFDTLPLDRYSPQILIEALAIAAASGYDVVVVDSLSHFWMGADGMLEQVDKATKRAGRNDSFGSGWKDMAPVEQKMIQAMLAFPGHVIVTMRQKTEWVIEDRGGKKVPKKIGLKAIQRDGLEYEFTVVGDLDHENELIITKTRCKALAGAVIRKPNDEFGRTILAWLEDGESSGPSAAEFRDEILANPYLGRDELLTYYKRAEAHALLGSPLTDEHGDATTLGEFIAAKGKAAADAARGVRPISSPPAAKPPAFAGANAAAAPLSAGADKDTNNKRMAKLHAMFGDARIGDRDDKLAFVNALMAPDRQVTSTADLSDGDLATVYDALSAAIVDNKEGDR